MSTKPTSGAHKPLPAGYLLALLVVAAASSIKHLAASSPVQLASPTNLSALRLPPPPAPSGLLLPGARKLVKLANQNWHKQYLLAPNSPNQIELNQPSTQTHFSQHQLEPERRPGLLEKVCIGTSNRDVAPHNKTDHYQNLAERYTNCTYVIGNLELTWLERSASLGFLESIREVTGYLLVAHVDSERIRMPNLQIIRGRDLFKLNQLEGQSEEFALILIENQLRSLELPSLREILAGSVGSYNNRNLCHIRSINWDEILNWPMYRSVFVYSYGTEPDHCPACDPQCQGSCWAPGPDMCQKFSKTNCSPQCSAHQTTGGRCFGPSAAECCHAYCAGGCSGPKQSDCMACRNFYDDGECIQECSSIQRYNPTKFIWEPNPNGKYAYGATCVKECPEHLLRDNGACVKTCPPNKRNQNGECMPCSGPCPKNCQGVEVVHSGNIDQLINCTVIEGSITILDTSFTGHSDLYSKNSIGPRYQPMHPSRLEVFKQLSEITGYLNIQANHSDFTNLSYFSNLKTIGGRQTTDMLHSLSIVKTSLVSLNLRSLERVRSGKVLIEENPHLCFANTIDWVQANITSRDDITIRNNRDDARCQKRGLQCHQQCTKHGCWGPGPDECLSSNNYKLDDFCVDNCQSAPHLSYDVGNRTCKRCHAECRGGCSGPEARHCWQCRAVKDGPYCVAECPSHKYNNNGTCLECNKMCLDGCSGPSSHLGEGGCNSCPKAVIGLNVEHHSQTSAPIVQCIKADAPCREGYYQEYVHSQLEGLKQMLGKPICRRCHHRCKTCTGMGTHTSVCECAKYTAGEQCEDSCPRDYFADHQLRQCTKCSSECNGCTGPTEADCVSCRIYRVYYELPLNTSVPQASAQLMNAALNSHQQGQVRFNCTAQCPPDKPHRISDSNMLDPYCSEDPGVDLENPRIVATTSTSIFFMLIISASIMVCFSVYRCQIEKDKTVKLTMHLSGIDDVEPLTPSNLKPNLAPLRNIKETELRKGKVLGSGFGGTVYGGFWFPDDSRGSAGSRSALDGSAKSVPIPVAIKVLRDNGQSNMNKKFLEEAYTMASVNHPNLVRLLAVCMTPNHQMLVTQLMPLGCLLEYVRKHKNEIGPKNLLEWCKQIARGMSYLEDRRIVHRDLALRNVLLQTSGKALISDFGLAKFLEVDQNEYHSGGGRLPIKWLAPECIRERKFTHKSDVWAFGVTIWELLTFGRKPYEKCDNQEILAYIESGEKLEQPKYVTGPIYIVMLSCWAFKPDDRPNFRQLAQDFGKFARDPQYYLICNSKGLVDHDAVDYNSDDYEPDEETSEGGDDGDDLQDSPNVLGFGSLSTPTTATTANMPDLTPSTHNRLNEMFDFEVRRNLADSGAPQEDASPKIAALCELTKLDQDRHLQQNHQQFVRQHHLQQPSQYLRGQTHLILNDRCAGDINFEPQSEGAYMNASSQYEFFTDLNNNNSDWTVQHVTSNKNTMAHKVASEQPTDTDGYLMPSPCTNNDQTQYSAFFTGHSSAEHQQHLHNRNSVRPINQSPPVSAGLIGCGVHNEEYFLRAAAYVNQQYLMRSENDLNSQTSDHNRAQDKLALQLKDDFENQRDKQQARHIHYYELDSQSQPGRPMRGANKYS